MQNSATDIAAADATPGAARAKSPVTEGGRGWLIVLGGFTTFLLWSGFLKGMGLLLPTLTTYLTENTGLTGEIMAMVDGVRGLAGPLVGPTSYRLGYRPVAMVSGAIAACGVISASFAQTTTHLLLSLVLMTGVGFSAPLILTKAMIGRYFKKRFALAISLASAGDSAAMIIMAPLVQVFLDTYGWKGALLLMGGLCLYLIVVGALLREPHIQDDDQQGCISIPANDETSNTSVLQTFKLSILTKWVFWLIILVMVGTNLIGLCWYVYFVPHTEAKGFPPSEAVSFVVAAGIGQIITKITMGNLIDQGIVSIRASLVVSITTCSVTLAIDPLIHTFWPMMIVTIIFGSSFGLIYCLVDVFIARELVGEEDLASAFGYIDLISGMSKVIIGFLPGWIYDRTGSYDIVYMVLGGGYLTILLPLVAEWIIYGRATSRN